MTTHLLQCFLENIFFSNSIKNQVTYNMHFYISFEKNAFYWDFDSGFTIRLIIVLVEFWNCKVWWESIMKYPMMCHRCRIMHHMYAKCLKNRTPKLRILTRWALFPNSPVVSQDCLLFSFANKNLTEIHISEKNFHWT